MRRLENDEMLIGAAGLCSRRRFGIWLPLFCAIVGAFAGFFRRRRVWDATTTAKQFHAICKDFCK